jgi:hypothetical protein
MLALCGEVSYVQNQFVIGVQHAFTACLLTISLVGREPIECGVRMTAYFAGQGDRRLKYPVRTLTRSPEDTPPTKKNYGRNHHLLKRDDNIRPALIWTRKTTIPFSFTV